MAQCETCGAFVTPDFTRVFGNNRDEVYRCPNCANLADIAFGGAARP